MSKLSFRARALDANKSLPVYHEKDVPDLPDIASVNRVVPQMPTGMEKEEESEHHLQRAISAQQIYGGSQRLIIPTPDAILYDSDYKQLKQRNVHMPKQLIHVQAFTLEDELPDYDADEEDEKWHEKFNKDHPDTPIHMLDLERIFDTLEKSCSSRIDLFTLSDAQALVKKDEKVVKLFFEYWKEKREKLKGLPLAPAVRTEKKDGIAMHDPYVAFRRRVEKMQTRKNRKNDESSYEKMLKLRRDLNRACLILEMVKHREERKKNLLQTTIKVLETRYAAKDFNGELLHQCYELLKQRQHDHKPPLQNSNNNVRDQGVRETKSLKRSEIMEEQKKRKLLKQQQRAALVSNLHGDHSSETGQTQSAAQRDIDKSNEGPDGKYTFRRKKGVIYHAPRYDSIGNWPWEHPVEGGSGASQYAFAKTSISKECQCIGFARRRLGRGGRINFDRVYAPFDEVSNNHPSERNQQKLLQINSDRVPPWPHYKRLKRESNDDDVDTERSFHSSFDWFKKIASSTDHSSVTNNTRDKLRVHKSFSTEPTSRFRVQPYSHHRTNQMTTGRGKKSRPTSTSQMFSNSSSFSKNAVDSHSWILRRSSSSTINNNNNNSLTNNNKLSANGSEKNSLHHLSPSRPASTAPASAIYQLNFPITVTKTLSANTITANAKSKTETTSANKNSTNSNNNNNTILKTVATSKTSLQNALQVSLNNAVIDSNAVLRLQSTGAISSNIISRQPLTTVQQKIISQSVAVSVSVTTQGSGGTLLQVQPVVNNVRTSKINNLPKGLTINHTTPTVVSNGITTQPQSIQQLAR